MQQRRSRFYLLMLILLIVFALSAVLLKTCHKRSRERQTASGIDSRSTIIRTSDDPAPIPTPQPTPILLSTPTSLPMLQPTIIPAPIQMFTPTPPSTPVSRSGLITRPAQYSTPIPGAASTINSYSCTIRKTCAEMSSCDEAYYHLNICGTKRLDRDNDGVPCENICPGG